jgi:hypothetical protein
LGKDAIADDGTGFAWYQGLKLSLFDVSNVNAPTEVAKMIIGDRGTSSAALYDPKAFLFDKSSNLLVIPVELYLINENGRAPVNVQNGTAPSTATDGSDRSLPISPPSIGSGFTSSQYGEFVWQGVYIFEVGVDDGFEVRGNVTQFDHAASLLSDPTLPIRSDYRWIDYNHYIERSIYIDNVLYTFSESRVQLNSLDDFSLIAKIELN